MSNVILVVDMLNGFLKEGNLANPNAMRIVPNIVDLIKRKVKQGWEVIFVADNHKKNDLEFLMFPEHCVSGTEEINVITELEDVNELAGFVVRYIPKTRYSAFFDTSLESILDGECAEDVVVVGIYADICVLYTTADLRNRDYNVIVPKDCTMTLAGIDNVIFDHMKKVLGVNVVDSQKEI